MKWEFQALDGSKKTNPGTTCLEKISFLFCKLLGEGFVCCGMEVGKIGRK